MAREIFGAAGTTVRVQEDQHVSGGLRESQTRVPYLAARHLVVSAGVLGRVEAEHLYEALGRWLGRSS